MVSLRQRDRHLGDDEGLRLLSKPEIDSRYLEAVWNPLVWDRSEFHDQECSDDQCGQQVPLT